MGINLNIQNMRGILENLHSIAIVLSYCVALQSLASLATVLKDGLRRGERMSVSHWGHLASLTDSFGRVLLIETRTFIVIRLWKVWNFCKLDSFFTGFLNKVHIIVTRVTAMLFAAF